MWASADTILGVATPLMRPVAAKANEHDVLAGVCRVVA